MRIFDYICLMIILMAVGFVYRRYVDKYESDDELEQYNLIKRYLLNDSSITRHKKPIIWIHIPYEYNSRNWSSFGSRSSMNLNLPYQNLTVRSIIDHNPNFHICLIDDTSFNNLLPGWTIDITKVGEPQKHNIRKLCLLKLLYNYGGMIVPSSFLCLRSLEMVYDLGIKNDKPFVVENRSRIYTGQNAIEMIPDASFMGAPKNNSVINKFCAFTENLVSTDYTNEPDFLGDFNKWCIQAISTNQMNLISGTIIGTKDSKGNAITPEMILGENYIDINDDVVGIYIPGDEILSRTSLNWFCYLDEDKILTMKSIIGKYFIIAKANIV